MKMIVIILGLVILLMMSLIGDDRQNSNKRIKEFKK